MKRDLDAVDHHCAVVRLETYAALRAVGQLAPVNEQLVVDALGDVAVISAYGKFVEFVRIDRFLIGARVGNVPGVRGGTLGKLYAVGRRRIGTDGHLIIRKILPIGRYAEHNRHPARGVGRILKRRLYVDLVVAEIGVQLGQQRAYARAFNGQLAVGYTQRALRAFDNRQVLQCAFVIKCVLIQHVFGFVCFLDDDKKTKAFVILRALKNVNALFRGVEAGSVQRAAVHGRPRELVQRRAAVGVGRQIDRVAHVCTDGGGCCVDCRCFLCDCRNLYGCKDQQYRQQQGGKLFPVFHTC